MPLAQATVPALNTTAAALLGFLADAPRSAAELYDVAAAEIGEFWTLSRTQVRRELEALERHGRLVVAPGDPPRYATTPAGRTAFRSWLAADLRRMHAAPRLVVKLTFARHLAPDELEELISAQLRHHRGRLAAYRARQRRQPGGSVGVTYGVLLEESILRWLEGLRRSLAG